MTLQEAIERAQHSASSGGHSELVARGCRARQIRLTYLRPYDRFGRPLEVPSGFVFGALSVDERKDPSSPWEPFRGFGFDDVAAEDWTEVPVAEADDRGRCVAVECFQHGHGGGWTRGQPTRQLPLKENHS